nr:hypothetical protein [Pandoravirus massiliensis]
MDRQSISGDKSVRLALTDLAPELHCHIIQFLNARDAVAYVGASRTLRVLDHAQALALRPAAGIGECLCGCDMHECDRCSCGTRYDNIHRTIGMGCSTLCYPNHVSALLAADRVDDARAFCRRLMSLVLPAFAHLGEERSREAFASWILYDALICKDESRAREAAALLAHEIAGTCVFRQGVWEMPGILGAEDAMSRGHYECIDRCINNAECPSHDRLEFFEAITAYGTVERAACDDDGHTAHIESFKAWCNGVVRYRPTIFNGVSEFNRHIKGMAAAGSPIQGNAHAILAQFVPGIINVAADPVTDDDTPDSTRLWRWSRKQSTRLCDALAAKRLDDFDALCAEARQKMGDGEDASSMKAIVDMMDEAYERQLHKRIVYGSESDALFVIKTLSTHFPHAWANGLGAELVGPCSTSDCTPCTSVMHVTCVKHTGDVVKLGGRHLCFALWPSVHERGRRVRGSRARALALLACDSVRWPQRAALTAAAYGDMEVLDVLAPQRATTDPWLGDMSPNALAGTKLPLWMTGVVALLTAAGYHAAARHMASRYRIDQATLDVAAIIHGLDATKPRRPWSSLYSAIVPRCPLPLAVLPTLRRADGRSVIAKAMARSVGVPMHPADCVHLAAAFPGALDGMVASQTILPTSAVGAIDWLSGQTALQFDPPYVISCASIGATATVHYLAVHCGIACDIDAVRAVLPDWVSEPFQDDGGDDDDGDEGGECLVKPVSWIDFMEPVLGKTDVDSAPVADSSGA